MIDQTAGRLPRIAPPTRLADVLPGPTLFDLPGRDPRPLFVSTLLHGNEYSGLVAVQEVLRRHAARGTEPRACCSSSAMCAPPPPICARCPSQRDFNRVWPGTPTPDVPEARMARWVYDYAARGDLFASIDIHNNTGFNPHYACVTRLEPKFIALAQLFSRIVVHFQRPLGMQAARLRRISARRSRSNAARPATASGTDHAVELSRRRFRSSDLPDHAPRRRTSICCAPTPL